MDEAVRGALWLAQRSLEVRELGGTQTSTIAVASQTAATTTSPASAATTSAPSTSTGPTSSPLLFFVALGFGVVFTNLWIIVGVKYCFRYNARNRAIRNGEEVDPIHMENMPTRPHRRRREKKLMTMDEVNERFPLTKYKTWVATRASEGLPTAGGVNASSASRPGSVRNVDGVVPASPVETKHSVNTRPATAASASDDEATPAPAVVVKAAEVESKKPETAVTEKDKPAAASGDTQQSEAEQTTAAPVDKQTTVTSVDEDEEEDDHIHTAVPPELLTNPGDSCAICIDTLEEDDDIRGLTCGHAFHAGCLDPWLTSRRACCPLCKADYYTPKPRPEGEATETDRNARRREARLNMPQQPHSTWTGIRSHPRLLLPTRFGSVPVNEQTGHRGARSRRQAAAAAAATTTTAENQDAQQAQNSNEAPSGIAPDTATPEVVEAPTQSRWRPRNPFSSVAMPRFPGRNRQDTPAEQATTEPSPSQLEAGTANNNARVITS